jgi:hypothetical protein
MQLAVIAATQPKGRAPSLRQGRLALHPVGLQHRADLAEFHQETLMQPNRLVAQPADDRLRMGGDDQDAGLLGKALQAGEGWKNMPSPAAIASLINRISGGVAIPRASRRRRIGNA